MLGFDRALPVPRQTKSTLGGVVLGYLNGNRVRRVSLDPKAKSV